MIKLQENFMKSYLENMSSRNKIMRRLQKEEIKLFIFRLFISEKNY